ncbi:hypothetical protein H5410_033586 [Solanum commersonii]|uniref:Uncharacterized protein n=1 Tax=Solanum commersonii TaxID=4109 RepID=A0A9J5YR87_SOLCO|nr:hypothetical protein H5410_033586 [Solanum commersonii]
MGDSLSPSNNSGTTIAPATSAMDSSHPYYLHPSDSPGMNLISTVFDGRVNHGNHNHSSGSPNLINGNGNKNFRNGYSGQKSGVYPQKPGFPSQRSGINTQRTRGKKSKYNPNVTCTYCFRTGHVMDYCHKLHGYLQDFEFTKGKNSMIKGTVAFAGEDNSYQSSKEGGTTNFQHFTKEQMAKITQMVKGIQMSQLMPST